MNDWKDDKNLVIICESGMYTVFYSKGGLLGNNPRLYYLAENSELIAQGEYDTDRQAEKQLLGEERREQ